MYKFDIRTDGTVSQSTLDLVCNTQHILKRQIQYDDDGNDGCLLMATTLNTPNYSVHHKYTWQESENTICL